METDQTVFNNQPVNNAPSNPAPVAPVAPITQPQTTPGPVYPQSPIPQPVSSNPPPANPGSSVKPPRLRLSKHAFIFRILIGLFVVLILFFIGSAVVIKLAGNSTTQAPTNVTLKFWGLWEDSRIMDPIIADFQKQNPSIKIEYSKQDIKQYRETLSTRLDNGNGPDIFLFHNTWYPMFSSSLLPVPTDTLTQDEFVKSYYPVAQNDLVKNGAIFGIPYSMDTLSLYVNKDIFASAGINPPTNWNDFIAAARTLTVKDESGKIKTAGAAMGTYGNVTHASDIVSLLFLQNSVDFSDIDASKDRIQSALNFYTSFSVDANSVWDNSLDPSLLAFSKGNLAMYFGYSWDYFTIKQTNPNLNFEITKVPQLSTQPQNMASYWAVGVSAKTQAQKQAFLFLKYLAQKSTAQALYLEEAKTRAFGELYGRADLAPTLEENKIILPFVEQSATANSSYFVDSTYDSGINQEMNTYLENAINSINNGTSVESAYDPFVQGLNQVLQKYGQ